MQKHLIFCTDGIFPYVVGGMQRHSRLLIEELAKPRDIRITVIHPHPEKVFTEGAGVQEISIEGIDEKKNYLLETYKYSKRVAAILDKFPDAIIYSQGLSVWYNCKKYKNRLIVNPHGLEPFQALTIKDKLIGLPFRQIFKYIFENSRSIISLGGKLTPILQSAVQDKEKVVVIPNAVNITKSSPEQKEKKESNSPAKALFVARFAQNKGIHILLQTIKRLNQTSLGGNYQFLLAGKGPLFEHYRKNFNYTNVSYLGFVSDSELEDLYQQSDVFVFPTLFEGMPTVVLEAMAKGLPIIVSDTGATAELVDQENGYLIKKNSVDSLYQGLVAFHQLSEEQKILLGKASCNKVQDNFTWQKVADRHASLFRSI